MIPKHHVLLIPPGVVHFGHLENTQIQTQAVNCLYVTLRAQSIAVGVQNREENVFCVIPQRRLPTLSERLFAAPGAVIDRMSDVLAGEPSEDQVRYCRSLCGLLLAALAEALSTPDREQLPAGRRAAVRAMEYIESHYPVAEMTLADVAREVRLAPTYLANLFKRVYGTTIRQTLIEIRLEEARRLLKEGRFSVKEVAYLTGWSDQLYFSKVYRKRYGYPPSQHLRG
jgi:AraC-like DNA-binding protein